MKKELTLYEVLALYVGLPKSKGYFSDNFWQKNLAWPPNMFAVCASILNETGVYVKLVSPTPSITKIYSNGIDGKSLQDISKDWKKNICNQEQHIASIWNDSKTIIDIVLNNTIMPDVIRSKVSCCFGKKNQQKSINELADDDEFVSTILFLLSLSDEACAGFGVDSPEDYEEKPSEIPLFVIVDLMLHENERKSLATFCTNRMSVLPKSLTATVGISLQSLSHHLALISGEVQAYWNDIKIDSKDPSHRQKSHLNILIIPYPYSIESEQFFVKYDAPHVPKLAKYFGYLPKPNLEYIVDITKGLILKSINSAHEVDLIVFPEATFRHDIFIDFLREMNTFFDCQKLKQKPVIIAGVIDKVDTKEVVQTIKNQEFEERNCSVLVSPHRYENEYILNRSSLKGTGYEQVKHHRWQLDHNQISTYEIGNELGSQPGDIFWEGISLENRRVVFTQWEDWFSVCTLICEDLARQEPVSSAIRSVGPNLIVALLFDGPQKKFRWPGRHATTLSEEPGSSVLTVTALGMSERSTPKTPSYIQDKDTSRTVALWRDKFEGEKELVLNDGDHGIILELSTRMNEQISADCRSDNGMSIFLTYHNHFSIPSANGSKFLKNKGKTQCV
ncbi:MAG: hypothetical protein HWD84_09205 [Flavobacteriaceae bacterium]|nr:hypothetical protein [Flavobacteriaceae bacterium]